MGRERKGEISPMFLGYRCEFSLQLRKIFGIQSKACTQHSQEKKKLFLSLRTYLKHLFVVFLSGHSIVAIKTGKVLPTYQH
jgi:hypothetical protein